MSSKPLIFYNDHKIWQLKVKKERKFVFDRSDAYQAGIP
mgnify:CR=1 FL=1